MLGCIARKDPVSLTGKSLLKDTRCHTVPGKDASTAGAVIHRMGMLLGQVYGSSSRCFMCRFKAPRVQSHLFILISTDQGRLRALCLLKLPYVHLGSI